MLELRSLAAESVVPTVGMRPLAFALPSEAERYSIPNSLLAVRTSSCTATPYTTPHTGYISTHNPSPRPTNGPSGIVNDTETDYSLDAVIDAMRGRFVR